MKFIKFLSEKLKALKSPWILGFYIPCAVLATASIVGTLHYTGIINKSLSTAQGTTGVASRINSLGEQITKSVLLIEKAVRDEQPVSKPVYELQVAADRLDQIINAFNEGSETVAPDGMRFMLEAVSDEANLAVLQEMNVIWVGIKTRADAVVLASGPKKAVTDAISFDQKTLSEAAGFVAAQQTRLAESSLAFSRNLEKQFTTRALQLELYRNTLIVSGVVSLLALPAVFIVNRARRARNAANRLAAELSANQGELETKSRALAVAKVETDRIMETIQEGLMLVDAQGVIGAQHSRELEVILRSDNLSGANLLHILQRLLSEKMYKTTKDYFELLFDARRKEKAVIKVNPLSDIEVSFANPEGGFIHRHLGFSFRRIIEGDKVDRVFVAVRDITGQVELEKRLRDAEKLKERQLEILLGIVHASSEDLVGFTELAERELNAINAALRAEDFASPVPDRQKHLHERLMVVFRSIHNIKGNAGFLRLDYFQKAADAFETKVSELLQRPILGGDDFLSIVVAQANLRTDLSDLLELQGKLTGLRSQGGVSTASASPAVNQEGMSEGLRKLAQQLASELGKEIDFQVDAHAVQAVAAFRCDLVRDILIQLIRNSLVHGIETPTEREAAGKPRVARLWLRAAPRRDDGLVGLALRDDGRGLDIKRIRERALSAGLINEGIDLPAGELARLIFSAGFSTADKADLNAGRGVGLDLLKTRVVDEIGGEIEVTTSAGRFCEFTFHLPEIPELSVV